MAAKKPSAKATQAKKTASKKLKSSSKKPISAKKAASVKKPSVQHARKPASARSKAASKAAPKATHKASKTTASVTLPKSAKAPAMPPAEETAKHETQVVQNPVPPQPTPIPAENLAPSSQVEADQSADADEGDEGLATNLLSGPRNVRPYIPKRDEQYMSKEQLEHFRTILENWKRDLMREVDRTMLHMKDEAANFPDPNDRATQESEFSLELRTRDRERKLIRKIDEAIKRIDDGTYGYCVETGEEIGIKRLEARPVATLCVEAQERRERREKQYGDRDDRYR